MLIDMDDTIVSAYGRPDVAWNKVTAEFAGEFAPLSSQQVAAAIVDSGRRFWASAQAEWRLKLPEARHEVVRGGFAALAAALPVALGIGSGGDLRQPLGVAVGGGLLVSQVVTLFITPVIYVAFENIAARLRGRRAPQGVASPAE